MELVVILCLFGFLQSYLYRKGVGMGYLRGLAGDSSVLESSHSTGTKRRTGTKTAEKGNPSESKKTSTNAPSLEMIAKSKSDGGHESVASISESTSEKQV